MHRNHQTLLAVVAAVVRLLAYLCRCPVVAAAEADEKYACYRNDVLVDVLLQTESDARFVRGLGDVDAWSHGSTIVSGAVNRIRTSQEAYQKILGHENLRATLVAPNLEEYLHRKQAEGHRARRTPRAAEKTLNDTWYATWHSYDEITAKLAEISAEHPAYTTFMPSIGEPTHENRSISALRFGRNRAGCAKVALIAGEHAREWIGVGSLMWMLGRLVQDLSSAESVVRTRDVDIYVVPCYNPDGYEYSRSSKRLWRKNRRDNGDGTFGVDLNRNWDNNWCAYGGSRTTSYQTYCGEGPFSEPETRTMSGWINATGFDALVDIHSYAGQILRPYGYKTDKSPDDDRLLALSNAMAEDVFAASGARKTSYEPIRGVDLYPASGAGDDWSYENAGIPTVLTIEMAGEDFVVGENEIEMRGDELYPAILRVIHENSKPAKEPLGSSSYLSEESSRSSVSGASRHAFAGLLLMMIILSLFL